MNRASFYPSPYWQKRLRHATCTIGSIALFILCMSPLAQAQEIAGKNYALGLGRLLTTEAERVQINQMRFGTVKKNESVVEGPASLHIDGITQRPDQPVTIWLDGKPYQEHELPRGLKLKREANIITGLTSTIYSAQAHTQPRVAFAKIGDDIASPVSFEQAKNKSQP